jgi:hypothetical protein
VAVVSAPRTVASATRRLVGLTALRWLPVGLTMPITVLLAQARGLSLAEIGLLFTVHGVVVVALELPTGGLADALGRRPVIVAGAVLHLASCLLFATATTFAGFLAGILALGLGRTLDSGPLEAWYVDTVHRLDPGADVAPGLARHSAADGAGLAVGAVAGGLVPGLPGGDALALPFLVAAALELVHVAAVLRLLGEDRPARAGTAPAVLLAGMRALPATIGGAVRLSVTDRPMRLVLLLTAAGGVGLAACELLGPLRFADLAGGADEGAGVYGTVLAVSFAAAAFGSMAAPALRRLLRGSTRVACLLLTLAGAGATAVQAGPDVVAVAAAGFAVFYVAHGATWPLLGVVLHDRVTATHRATAVSAMSLAMALGGIVGNLVLPRVVAASSAGTAFLGTAVVLAVAALACLRLPAGRPTSQVTVPSLETRPTHAVT